MWSFISYLGRAQPPPSSCFYGVSAIMEFLSAGEKLFSLGPIYLLPQFQPDSGGDVLISFVLQPFTGGPGQDVSCELNKGILA